MTSRDYYKVAYNSLDTSLDNETEFNANQFKLYDDFTTDLRINYNPLNDYSRCLANGRVIRRSFDRDDSGVDLENNTIVAELAEDDNLLDNEVMVDPWSSMDSSNSPLTDSVPSASDDCTPSTSSENHNTLSLETHGKDAPKPSNSKPPPKARLTLDLDIEPLPRRHFLDEDFPTKSNIECRIPKPHFLDHSPTTPDEFDERSDITNPNFLDDDEDESKKAGALPKKPQEKPRSNYRTALYGFDAARSSERDKRASQLYRGTWPGEWPDTASVRSFSSNGSAENRPSSNIENKMDCVCSLISLLSLSPENNADLSGPLLEMSRSVESCIAMRQAGCIPLLVQLVHSKVSRETRDRAAKALRNIIHTQTDDKAGRREARVWRLLEQVREYCYSLEDVVEAKKEGKQVVQDDNSKHPSQSVAALMKLSFDEEHRHVVCQLGGLQALASLVSGDQSAHGSRTDDHTCLTMRKYAGMTLTNLTFGDGNNKSLLCSFKEFMMALVEQLESPNDDMRQVTAAVLRNLSWRADTNSKQVLREVGAVKGLTKAAMTCQKEATLKSVLSALWNLTAHCSMNKVALCSVDGALGFLVDMLSYDSPTKTLAIVENAGGIMRNVSSHIAIREDYRQILRERNCLSVLLQHLKSPSLTVVSNSCGTLWNLSARCPEDQQFLWDHGAVPMLRSLIHSKHKMIAMGSSAALKNLLNSKPGKTHIISLDTTARSMNLPALPTLGARKQKALEQELDQNLAETCDNIEPITSPSTSNREEKNLFTATERQIAMNLERHRMTSSSPLMGSLTSQVSLSHSAHLAYLSCTNTLLKGALTHANSNPNNVNRSDSKDSVTSTHSDSVFERVMRTGKVPVPTPRNKLKEGSEAFKVTKDAFLRYPSQPPIPPPRTTDMRTNYTESGYDVDQDSCDQPIDYSQKYSETKNEVEIVQPEKPKKKTKKDTFGDYQETDLDHPTDYSLRYAEHQSETGSDSSEPPVPSVDDDTIKHFATEGTPYETPIIFSTATSMSDLRVIGKQPQAKTQPQVKQNPEIMTHSDEKDTCSIEDPPHDNDRAVITPQNTEPVVEKSHFDTKFSSGMISPEKPVNYCDEGTPGYFSRVSSLSSLGEPTEEDCLAKKNAMATINVGTSPPEASTSSMKDKEGSKAVTFAESLQSADESPRFVEDTPLMFSRCSSLGSLPECDINDQGSVHSELSRLTSGCISPSEIPDSPGCGASLSPRRAPQGQSTEPSTPPQENPNTMSVFEERVSHFVVENTPAQFSYATSLSSLTIDDEPRQRNYEDTHRPPIPPLPESSTPMKGSRTPRDVCQVYCTEDTPAILSKAGSNSNLSALSIDSTPVRDSNLPNPAENLSDVAENLSDVSNVAGNLSGTQSDVVGLSDLSVGRMSDRSDGRMSDERASSDSSNLSDAGDLLEECIQKGIAKVVKNKGPPSDISSINPFRDEFYHSLPSYVRSSTETVRASPPPPLPPKSSQQAAPPRPPSLHGRKHESRLPIKTQHQKLKPADPALNDSLSSLSLDSFGSTDREIFEETVKAGLSVANPRTNRDAHSVERPVETVRQGRHHKSLDRSDKITQHKPRRDFDDRNDKLKKPITRSPFSYHGDSGYSLAHHSRKGRYVDDGPPSLPARIDDPNRRSERSNSLSSLSNDSFGSTDKEVFERSVKLGMSKAQKKNEAKMRVRSDDRLEMRERREDRVEFRESRRRRKDVTKPQSALDKMVGEEYSKDRAILEEVIARGAGERIERVGDRERDRSERDRSHSKNVLEPSALSAVAGELGNNAPSTHIGCENHKPDNHITDNHVTDNLVTTYDNHRLPETIVSEDKIPSDLSKVDGKLNNHGLKDGLATTFDDHRLLNNASENDLTSGLLGVEARLANLGNDSDLESNGTKAQDSALDITVESEQNESDHETSKDSDNLNATNDSVAIFDRSNELPTVDSGNTTFNSAVDETMDILHMDQSNECLAVKSVNTTIESEIQDELNRSNESYADVLDGSFSDSDAKNYEVATLTRKKNALEWTDIKYSDKPVEDVSKRSTDTWNDNTCPDDVTFPTISGSVHMVSSIRSEIADHNVTLPDLLEKSDSGNRSFSKPDLTNKLEVSVTSPGQMTISGTSQMTNSIKLDSDLLDNIPEPSFSSIAEGESNKFNSILSSAIEKEAARLAAQLKTSQYALETSVTSLTSLDLDNIHPPSNLGSLLSLSASGHWDENSQSKKSKSRKKSLPASLMVKRALSNSQHQGSLEHIDSNPASFLENVKPPSEMDHLDMESSMISVSSIVSEVAEKDAPKVSPVVFDFKQPIQDFPLCNNFTVFHDLENVNPPSLFDEMAESTVELEQTTAQNAYEDCMSTSNVVTDIPSGSENCTPLPSDVSSVESTPKKRGCLTPKEKRYVAKDRYQTYTITDNMPEDEILQVQTEAFMTWTKSESDKSDDYVTANSEGKSKKKLSAKQRRMEDRSRYQTQTVNLQTILRESTESYDVETLKQRLAKKTLKQRRIEDAERFRTRTLSEDIPPSPTFISKDAFENVETTTGYDSLSSNELNHQQISDDRQNDDIFSRETDSGHNDDDHDELTTTQMLTYTASYKSYLPVIDGPSTFDMCTVKNLKNIEMTESFRRSEAIHPSSSEFTSYEAELHSESDSEIPRTRPKPKITIPCAVRRESIDSNESPDREDCAKGIRGRKKAVYVSPYRRNIPNTKTVQNSNPAPKVTKASTSKVLNRAQSAKTPYKSASKPPSATTSPKKTPNRPSTAQQKPIAIPLAAVKPLPLVRQGTFTKEDSSVAAKNIPAPSKKPINRTNSKASTSASKPIFNSNSSPSRLPQLNRYSRPTFTKANSNPKQNKPTNYGKRPSEGSIKNSASNQSLQSNDSGKTITLARGSRQGSTSSVNSQTSKTNAKDVESKIANLWKKVEQCKKTNKPDKRVWIESEKVETVEIPKLIRSSTFEGQPKLTQAPAKQKSAIGIRVSQIPSLRPKSTPGRVGQSSQPMPSSSTKKPATSRVFGRKNGLG